MQHYYLTKLPSSPELVNGLFPADWSLVIVSLVIFSALGLRCLRTLDIGLWTDRRSAPPLKVRVPPLGEDFVFAVAEFPFWIEALEFKDGGFGGGLTMFLEVEAF